MMRLSDADAETLRAVAGTILQQHAHVYDLILAAKVVSAHLSGVTGVIESILRRAEARAE